MLVPKLVDPAEHTAAAGVLLARLAEANREGSEPEAELRLPVLAALGLLYIDPAVAEKVLRAALDVSPIYTCPNINECGNGLHGCSALQDRNTSW